MHYVLHVAIAVVAVHEHRQVASCHDVAHAGRDFAEAFQADVGHAVACADCWEATNEIGLETDVLDQPGTQRVMRAGHHQKFLILDGLVDDLAKARRH